MDTNDKICLTETGGSSITRYKTLFSHDAKYLMCPCGNIIKVYSMTTGECYQRLVSHSKLVTGIAHHPKIKLQILSCSVDSTVKIWDYEDGYVLSTFEFDVPLIGIFSHQKYFKTILIIQKRDHSNEVHKFNLPSPGLTKDIISTKYISRVADNFSENYIALSENFVAVAFTKSFFVFVNPSQLSPENKTRHKLESKLRESPITCIACHPTEKICATAHGSGRIRIWYNITNPKKAVSNVKHWHSLSVCALSYSASGSMLLSGGREKVLVQWRGDDCDFLPRLGSDLTGISVAENGLLYAVSMKDNSILVISNTFKIKQCIEGFAAASNDFPCGFHYDPATNSCVTNGKPGHLLFYLCPTDTQLYNLDVICQNFISSADLSKPLSRTAITNVAFMKSQNDDYHMATVEFNSSSARDQKLKFWVYDETKQNWLIETAVSSPHNNKKVTSLCFHPHEKLAVTTSRDCSAKVWIKVENCWNCDTAMSYRGFLCNQAAFSQDGSVLALVFGESVLLANFEDLNTLTLFTSLSVPVKSIHFGRGTCSHLMVITTCDQIQCWDLASCAISWYSEIENITFVVQDQFSENMALFTDDKEVFIFRPCESTPLLNYDADDVIVAACFVPEPEEEFAWMQKSSLYVVSKDAVVKKFTTLAKAEESRARRHRAEIDGSLNTPMSSLLSLKIGKAEIESGTGHIRHSTVENSLKYIRDTPVHVLPGMSSLCEQFITSLLFDNSGKDEEMQTVVEETPPETMEIDATENTLSGEEEERKTRFEDFSFLVPTFAKMFQNK